MTESGAHPVRVSEFLGRPAVGKRQAPHTGGLGGTDPERCVLDGEALGGRERPPREGIDLP